MNNMFDYLVSKNLGMHKAADDGMLPPTLRDIKSHPGKLTGWMSDQIAAANEHAPRVQLKRSYIDRGALNRFGRNLRDVGTSFVNGVRGRGIGIGNDLLQNGNKWLEYKINNGDFERGGQRATEDALKYGTKSMKVYWDRLPEPVKQAIKAGMYRYGVTSDAK